MIILKVRGKIPSWEKIVFWKTKQLYGPSGYENAGPTSWKEDRESSCLENLQTQDD